MEKDTFCYVFEEYHHENPLPKEVKNAAEQQHVVLLERCLWKLTQINNKSLNSIIWSMASKSHSNGWIIIETAAALYDDRYKHIL